MANGRITVRKAQAGDVAALTQALRETFEGTWLPHVTQASARRYVETDTFNERTRNVYKAVGYIRKDRYPDDEWDSGFATVLFVKRPG